MPTKTSQPKECPFVKNAEQCKQEVDARARRIYRLREQLRLLIGAPPTDEGLSRMDAVESLCQDIAGARRESAGAETRMRDAFARERHSEWAAFTKKNPNLSGAAMELGLVRILELHPDRLEQATTRKQDEVSNG